MGDEPRCLRVRFQVYEEGKNWPRAYETARALVEHDGAMYMDAYNFARIAGKLRKLQEAYNSIERAIDLAPDEAAANSVKTMALDNADFREMWAHISEI